MAMSLKMPLHLPWGVQAQLHCTTAPHAAGTQEQSAEVYRNKMHERILNEHELRHKLAEPLFIMIDKRVTDCFCDVGTITV